MGERGRKVGSLTCLACVRVATTSSLDLPFYPAGLGHVLDVTVPHVAMVLMEGYRYVLYYGGKAALSSSLL